MTFCKKNGFEFLRAKGSHQIFVNRKTSLRTVVPMHNKDLKRGTLHGILKQAGIDPDKLQQVYFIEYVSQKHNPEKLL